MFRPCLSGLVSTAASAYRGKLPDSNKGGGWSEPRGIRCRAGNEGPEVTGIPRGTMAAGPAQRGPRQGHFLRPEIYCVKCKARTGSRDIQVVTLKNGSPATRAFCGACGTQKFRMGPAG